MRILITGSAGFIGSHFCRHLADRHDITTIDINDPARPQDCRQFFAVDEYPYDLVIHCAAVVGGRAKIDGDPLAIAQNLAIDSDMFRWALRARPQRVVYFSSSAAYPVWLQQPPHHHRLGETAINLDHPQMPDQIYGWAKLTGELLARQAAADGLKVHVFRPFSGYGEDQALDYPFPSFIDRALREANPFDVWGDGTQTRDWIHVDDIVNAVLTAIREDIRGPVNLCSGRPTTFDQLAHIVFDVAGYQPHVNHLPAAPTGVHHRVGDPTLLRTFYQPKVSLAEGIQRSVRHRLALR